VVVLWFNIKLNEIIGTGGIYEYGSC